MTIIIVDTCTNDYVTTPLTRTSVTELSTFLTYSLLIVSLVDHVGCSNVHCSQQ